MGLAFILFLTAGSRLPTYFDADASSSFIAQHRLRERAQSANGTLWVTVANLGHELMTRNLAASFAKQDFGRDSLFVFTLCDTLHARLAADGIASAPLPVSWLPPRFRKPLAGGGLCEEQKWEAADYNMITQVKAWVVLHLLHHGLDVGFSDVDIGYGRADVLRDMDRLRTETGMHMLLSTDGPSDLASEVKLNSGFYLARATPASVAFFLRVGLWQERAQHEVDQTIFNDVFVALGYTRPANGVTMYLNPLLYTNGYIVQHTPFRAWGIRPMTFHANWMIGKGAKEQAIKDAGMWYVGAPAHVPGPGKAVRR